MYLGLKRGEGDRKGQKEVSTSCSWIGKARRVPGDVKQDCPRENPAHHTSPGHVCSPDSLQATPQDLHDPVAQETATGAGAIMPKSYLEKSKQPLKAKQAKQ